MNLIQLLNEFSTYLIQNNKLEDIPQNSSNPVSLFSYASEFKEYCRDELDLDSSAYSASIDDILEMDFQNGQFTNNSNMPVTDVLNNFFQNQEMISLLDSDSSGQLSQMELGLFLENIQSFDGNIGDISLTDIASGIDALKSGNLFEIVEISPTAPITPPETMVSPNTNSGGSSSGFSGGDSSYDAPKVADNKPKSYSQMDKSQLSNAYSSENKKLQQNKDSLSGILNGSDSTLQGLEATKNEKYNIYQDELKKVNQDMASELDAMTYELNTEEDNLDKLDADCVSQEQVVSDKQAAYESAKDRVSSLKSAQQALNSTDFSSLSPDEKSAMESKRQQIQSQITQAEVAESTALEEKTKAEEELTKLKEQREEQQFLVDKLKTDKANYEMQIASEYPQISVAQSEYQAAEKAYNDYKTQSVSNLRTAISQGHNNVRDINVASSKIDNTKEGLDYSLLAFYDEEKGNAIAQQAINYAKGRSASGNCGMGVRIALEKLGYKGIQKCKGKEWAEKNLANNKDFVEITSYISKEDIKNGKVPVGAIVCFSEYDSFGYGSGDSGHVAIVVEYNGKICEASDYIRKDGININMIEKGNAKYRIFIPKK